VKKALTPACPCHSGALYEACCAPYHRCEREAPDPVALMRSRYAAFALGEAEYLLSTLHDDHPDLATPRAELREALPRAGGRRKYTALTILDERRSGGTAEVLFAAGILEGGRDVSFVELSDFERDRGGWRYRSGIVVPIVELGRDVEGLTIDDFVALAAGDVNG
jgi:SEC-C motif-containing protein